MKYYITYKDKKNRYQYEYFIADENNQGFGANNSIYKKDFQSILNCLIAIQKCENHAMNLYKYTIKTIENE